MSVRFPPAFEERMRLQRGADFDNFRAAHEENSPVSIRFNPAKAEPPVGRRVPWTQYGAYLKERPVFTLDPLIHGGKYYVQEASSMFLEQALCQTTDVSKALNVLDLCAAPGGKSTHVLSLISPESLLVSNEVIRTRATILSENMQKWGYPNVVVTNNDPQDFQALKGFFDVIVLDAPCSGEGLFRKDHNAVNEWSPDSAALCAQRQERILGDIWPSLKKDGILLYCTCTYNEAENENVLAPLVRRGDAESLDLTIDPSWGIEKTTVGGIAGFHFYPNKTAGEGFFCAALKKTQEQESSRIRSKHIFHQLPGKTAERLHAWILNPEAMEFVLQEDLILMLPRRHRATIEFLSKELRVITKGTAIASLKHDKLIPEHAIALSSALNTENFMTVEAELATALTYLRKDNLRVDDARKGFALVRFEGLPLGWVNLLGNRVNSLYPSAWRIRMA